MTDSSERLRRVRELFDAVVDLPPEQRQAYLDGLVGLDAGFRREVEVLITRTELTDPRLASPLERSAAAADGSALVGQRLGPYNVVRLIGMGGMGAVYEAVRADDQYRKRVAIKLVQGSLSSALTLARFRRERQILANLEHRNIATLLDGGVSPDGRPFLVMEYVEGEPITIWCDRQRRTVRQRLALFRQVCAAVQHAHQNLVIHRDLKPGNMLVTDDGTVKLLDFGIAKLIGTDDSDEALPLTRGGLRAFTPEYASPEQVRGDVLSTASDVYSLGVVLYEMLAGRRPHIAPGRTAAAIERAVLEEPVPRPSSVATDEAARHSGERGAERLRRRLGGELDSILLMALRPEPERRYHAVEALGDDLQRHLAGLPVTAQKAQAGYLFRKFVTRHRNALIAASLVVAALVGGVITTTRQAHRARVEQQRAETVNGFLGSLLSSVKPSTGGRDVPVSELLDAAAHRVETELTGQPEVRVELETVIGESYQSLGRLEEAERHARAALALREQLNGRRSLPAILAMSYLGGVYLAEGQNERADSLFRAGLALQEEMGHGADTLRASLYDNMGSLAHGRGDVAEAERYHRGALEIRRRLLGDHADAVAYSLNNVGVALGEQGRWAAAESLHRAAVQIFSANHPGPSRVVADVQNALATALDIQGKYVEADSLYRDVLARRRQLLGAEHPDYAFTLVNYAAFLFDRGRYDEALAASEEVLALRGKSLPESHSAVATSLQTLGRCRDHLGDTVGGGRALEESLALRRKYLSADSWLVGSSLGLLGEHDILVKDYSGAERALLEGQAIFLRALGPDHPRTHTNRRRLITLYEAWGRPADAARYRAELPPAGS